MTPKKILITDRFAQDSLLFLQQHPFLQIIKAESLSHHSQTDIASCHGMIIRSRTQITEDLLKKARNLQLIITATSGFDHIDLAATKKWGITVMHTPSANTESAAQLTWALVLNCCSRILQANRMVKSGEWQRDQLVGMELKGRNYGIVGLGRIGSRVAQIAQCFGMNVSAFDPYQDDHVFQLLNVNRIGYEELLKSSDVISFHVPKTLETDHMLNRSHFEYIHRGVTLINTSRGSVINENDLVDAIEKKWIGCVGLDVFEKEPLSRTSKLLTFHNVVMTPHIGANTDEAFFKASSVAAQKLVSFFVDGTTADTLPPRAHWYGATPAFKD